MKPALAIFFCLLVSLSACNLPSSSPAPDAASTAVPTTRQTDTPPPLDLDRNPLYFFAPLPPDVTGLERGAVDFMDLFEPGSDWDEAAGHLQVFKFYGGWVAREVSAFQLGQVIQAIRQRGLGLAVEVGPLNFSDACGSSVESFAGVEGIETLRQIKAAGGDLNFITFDEPYFYGHFYDGPNACNWTAEKIARDVGDFIAQARLIYPDVVIGDIEPMTGPADPAAYAGWLETFKAINGYDLAFLHMDIDWADTSWPEKMLSIKAYGQEHGIPIGLIYTGNPQDQTNQAWLSIAGERVKRYELDNGGLADHIIFQSWNDKPDHALPESDPYTFTGFIRTYFADKSDAGLPTREQSQPGVGGERAGFTPVIRHGRHLRHRR